MKTVVITLDELKRIQSLLRSRKDLTADDLQLISAVVDLFIKEFEDPDFSLSSELSNAALKGEHEIAVRIKKGFRSNGPGKEQHLNET